MCVFRVFLVWKVTCVFLRFYGPHTEEQTIGGFYCYYQEYISHNYLLFCLIDYPSEIIHLQAFVKKKDFKLCHDYSPLEEVDFNFRPYQEKYVRCEIVK